MQGEVIYTILFAIYVNDCEMEFLNNCCQPVELKEVSLFLLQFIPYIKSVNSVKCLCIVNKATI
jgi:hypothetical protein